MWVRKMRCFIKEGIIALTNGGQEAMQKQTPIMAPPIKQNAKKKIQRPFSIESILSLPSPEIKQKIDSCQQRSVWAQNRQSPLTTSQDDQSVTVCSCCCCVHSHHQSAEDPSWLGKYYILLNRKIKFRGNLYWKKYKGCYCWAPTENASCLNVSGFIVFWVLPGRSMQRQMSK